MQQQGVHYGRAYSVWGFVEWPGGRGKMGAASLCVWRAVGRDLVCQRGEGDRTDDCAGWCGNEQQVGGQDKGVLQSPCAVPHRVAHRHTVLTYSAPTPCLYPRLFPPQWRGAAHVGGRGVLLLPPDRARSGLLPPAQGGAQVGRGAAKGRVEGALASGMNNEVAGLPGKGCAHGGSLP